MSATNGSGLSFRSRRRMLMFCMAAALLVPAVFASAASAKKPPKPKHFYYLALGDSISYGYSLVKFDENKAACKTEGPEGLNCEPPSAFENGFVNYVANFGKLPKKGKTSTVNLSCPGETSSGLIGHNELLGGGKGAAFNPCAWHNVAKFRRHYEYGTASQLEAALGLAKANPGAITLVSLQIGSNDELAVLGACRSKAYREAHKPPFASEAECVEQEAPALFEKIIKNMGDAIGVLRAGGYSGPVVVLGFYNPFGFLQHATDALQSKLNETIEGVIAKGEYGPRVRYANPFPVVNAGGVGGATEKEALKKYTEFYSIFAIEDERIGVDEEHEASELPGITAFEECCGSPNLAETTAFLEKEGIPGIAPPLATLEAEQEAGGKPNLAEAEAFQEAAGKPNLAEAEAFQETSGKPNLEESEKFQEESGKPNLKEATEAHEAEAHAGYIAACEGKGKNLAECEIGWATEGKAEYEAGVEQSFDEGVEAGFDAAVENGFDEAVEAGFDSAVKSAFDGLVKAAFDGEVKRVFIEKVNEGFAAAGSPGDIHPSALGYEELGKLVSAARIGL